MFVVSEGGGGGGLSAPSNVSFANNTLTWQVSAGTTQTIVQIFNSSDTLVVDTTIPDALLDLSELASGDYTYSLKASDGTAESSATTGSFAVGGGPTLLSSPANIAITPLSP